ncbi:MauE/DoxX family redox-associated membrane protein [Streptomyces griseoloalbus]|uniref:Methylamine utilisation protein MauE domain-containing protein n=1 Tax=Streptomyces griseoloalbus TaxID=67303 RepID=A0A7W8FE78_9ACTN|nr:MauE/DoxX family redox-associated membrane protein [Streptomyces albaduncus]MBB5130231.1 hypothetical protein [Streptomyces albaduncus]
MAITTRCLLGTVFLASFLSKTAGPGAFDAFVASLRSMRLLPPMTVRAVARGVVAAEGAIFALLLLPMAVATAGGFVLAAGLLTAFTAGIARVIRRGLRVPCRCFGSSAAPLDRRHLMRNAVLVTMAVVGACTSGARGPIHLGGLAVSASIGLALGVVVTALDDIAELFRPAPFDLPSHLMKENNHARAHHGSRVRGTARSAEPDPHARRAAKAARSLRVVGRQGR